MEKPPPDPEKGGTIDIDPSALGIPMPPSVPSEPCVPAPSVGSPTGTASSNESVGQGHPLLAKFPVPIPVVYELLTIEQLYDMQSPPWLVHGVIRRGELVVLYGEPSCGKTFAALDLALKIAAEREWWGYRTFAGSVLYLAGEGAFGLKNRVEAWECTRDPRVDVRALEVRILPLAVPFMDDDSFKRLLDTLKVAFPRPSAIIVDTLARHLVGGDENSAQDMGQFISRCAKLQVATGATVIVIHHTSKNGDSERGSSALRGAADVMIQVTKSGTRITLRGDKAKEAERLEPIHLEFERVWLGNDEYDKAVHSLVLTASDSADAQREEAAANDPGRVIRETLARFFDGPAAGTALKDESRLPKSTFYRALQDEQDRGLVGRIQDGRVRRYFLTPDAEEYVAPPGQADVGPGPAQSHGSPSGTEGAEGGQSQSESHTTPLGVGVERDWNCTEPDRSSLHPGEVKEKRRGKPRAKRGDAGKESGRG